MIGQNIIIQFEGKYASLYDNNKAEISDLFATDPFVSTLVATHRCHILATVKEYNQSRGVISIAIQAYGREEGSFAENQGEFLDLLRSIKLIRIIGGSDTMKWLGMEMRISKSTKSTSSMYD